MILRAIMYFYEFMYMIVTSVFFRTIMLLIFVQHKLQVCYRYYKINKALEKMIAAKEKQEEEALQQQDMEWIRKHMEAFEIGKDIPNLEKELKIGRPT